MDIHVRFAWPRSRRDPIADCREIGASAGSVKQASSAGTGGSAVREQEFIRIFVMKDDARRHEADRGKGVELTRKGIIPAKKGKSHGSVD